MSEIKSRFAPIVDILLWLGPPIIVSAVTFWALLNIFGPLPVRVVQ